MLNSHVSGQLTHFAPIQRIAKDAIELGDKLDTCVIVQNPDVRDLESLSVVGHARDMTDIDLDSALAAKAQRKMQSLDIDCIRIRDPVQKRLLFTSTLQWKHQIFEARLIATLTIERKLAQNSAVSWSGTEFCSLKGIGRRKEKRNLSAADRCRYPLSAVLTTS